MSLKRIGQTIHNASFKIFVKNIYLVLQVWLWMAKRELEVAKCRERKMRHKDLFPLESY